MYSLLLFFYCVDFVGEPYPYETFIAQIGNDEHSDYVTDATLEEVQPLAPKRHHFSQFHLCNSFLSSLCGNPAIIELLLYPGYG